MGRTIQSKLSLCFFLSFIQEANQINNQADNAVISVNVTLAIFISVMVNKKWMFSKRYVPFYRLFIYKKTLYNAIYFQDTFE